MTSFMVICSIVIIVLLETVRRMRGAARVPFFFWFLLILSAAAPIGVGWMVLNPGEAVGQAEVKAMKDHAQLTVPEGHSLLVTGILSDIKDDEKGSSKTSYSLKVQGSDWKQSLSGTVTKDNENSGPELDGVSGQGISETGTKKIAKSGENLQERFSLAGHGTIDILVGNYQGNAASSLLIEVIPSPPSSVMVWGFAFLISFFGIYFEAWKKCDKVAGDLAGLSMYPIFLCDGITPTASWRDVALSFLPGAFLGWGVVAGLAWLFAKYVASVAKPSEVQDLEEI